MNKIRIHSQIQKEIELFIGVELLSFFLEENTFYVSCSSHVDISEHLQIRSLTTKKISITVVFNVFSNYETVYHLEMPFKVI